MANYFAMNEDELQQERTVLRAEYMRYKNMALNLNMSRGKPCKEQLDLSNDMLKINSTTDFISRQGVDMRNYGVLEGAPEARQFFAELLNVDYNEVIVGGSSSLQLLYYLIDLGWRQGFVDSQRPWRHYNNLKFLCPVPGYDRHFRITEYFGFQMINIPMTKDGPDMNLVEELVKRDESIKGMWCVPLYSNPDGYVYSDETVRRLARMETAAPDFKLIWDHAYCVHHLTDDALEVPSILYECQKCGHSERPLMLCSTSKITFPGAGVAALAASERNLSHIVKNMEPMIISFDKMNQLRHVRFLKNKAGVLEHMKKHRQIIQPKFDMIKEMFAEQLDPCGDIAFWTNPKGGYFISLYVMEGCAKRVVWLCKEAGVVLTGAGAAYPYGLDPKDSHIRIAPTYPSLSELKTASELLCIAVRLATVEKLLEPANR